METFFANGFLFGEETLNQIHLFLGSWFDWTMVGFTTMGNEIFYIMFIPIVFWCYDKVFAARVGGAFLIGVLFNSFFKDLFTNPRPNPELMAPGIRELAIRYIPQDSPGFPSGHTQNAVVFWGAIAWYLKKKQAFLIAGAIIALIAYSRLYLGVHFLGDVLGGFVFGVIVLAAYLFSTAWIEKNYGLLNQAALLVIVLLVPYLLFKFLHVYDADKSLGVLSGFLAGYILEKGRVDFVPRNKLIPTITKLIIGFSGLFLIKSGVKALLPHMAAVDYFRYWLIGIWITFFAPYLFSKLPSLRTQEE